MEVFYLMLLYFTVSVEPYGEGQQRGTKLSNNARKELLSVTNRQQQDISSSSSKMINKYTSNVVNISPQRDIYNSNAYGNGKKLLLEVNDLKTMRKQVTRDNIHDPANIDKKQQLLQHIETQIKLREMQQQRKQEQHKRSFHSKSEITPRNIKQANYPKRNSAVIPSNLSTAKRPFNDVLLRNTVHQPGRQSTLLTQQQPYQRNINLQIAKENNDVLQVKRLQQVANDFTYQKNTLQQIIPSTGKNVKTDTLASRHILIPVSALTSFGQGLNNKIILPHSLTNKINYRDSKGFLFNEAPTSHISTSPSTPTSSTLSGTTTIRPPVTSFTTTSSISNQESTTPFDYEVMRHKYLERAVKKQDLEIKKLKLEIRALQREEKHNISQSENDDTQQPRRGKFSQRQNMFPYNR